MIQLIVADSNPKEINSILSLLDCQQLSLEVVSSAATGAELLTWIHVFRPELVIMNSRFPDMSGFDVIRELRGNFVTHFLIVSEDASYESMRRAIQLKVEDYLLKPLNRPELNLAVKKMISHINPTDYSSYSKIIALSKSYTDLHFNCPITLEDVAQECYVSPSYLGTIFKRELGVNFKEYLIQLRMREACRLLHDPHYSIAQIANMVGYRDVRYFREIFTAHTGMTPSLYRKR